MKQEIFLPEFLIPFECDSLIRVGEGNDGSYLVDRSSIDMSEILISIGVGITFDFEKSVLALLCRHNENRVQLAHCCLCRNSFEWLCFE